MAALIRAGEEDGPALAGMATREGVTVAKAEAEQGANLVSEFSQEVPHPSMPSNSAESFVNELKTPGGVKNVLSDLNGAKGDINSAKTLNATKTADNAERDMSALNKAEARNTKLNNILQTVNNNPKIQRTPNIVIRYEMSIPQITEPIPHKYPYMKYVVIFFRVLHSFLARNTKQIPNNIGIIIINGAITNPM